MQSDSDKEERKTVPWTYRNKIWVLEGFEGKSNACQKERNTKMLGWGDEIKCYVNCATMTDVSCIFEFESNVHGIIFCDRDREIQYSGKNSGEGITYTKYKI